MHLFRDMPHHRWCPMGHLAQVQHTKLNIQHKEQHSTCTQPSPQILFNRKHKPGPHAVMIISNLNTSATTLHASPPHQHKSWLGSAMSTCIHHQHKQNLANRRHAHHRHIGQICQCGSGTFTCHHPHHQPKDDIISITTAFIIQRVRLRLQSSMF